MILVTTPAELSDVAARLAPLRAIGVDFETTSLDPYCGRIRLVQLSDGEETWVIDLDEIAPDDRAPLADLLAAPRPVKVAHNAKFEAKWFRHTFGRDMGSVFDTFLASQIISAGDRNHRHSLENVAWVYLDIHMDKTEQKSDWSGPLTESQLRYAAEDAEVMLPLRSAMIERLKADRLIRVAALEFDIVPVIAAMELEGMYLDRDMWLALVDEAREARDRYADELQDMLASGNPQQGLFFRPDINLDSGPQMKKALRDIGVPIEDTLRDWKIRPLAPDYPAIAKLLDYRKVAKQLSSFGENILSFIHDRTGRMHPEFWQIGAQTGRFSSRNPNVQQIPHDDKYRACFRAPEGRVFIVADYSQIELRILAHLAEDPAFIEAYRNQDDLHTVTAAAVFDVDKDDVTPKQRSYGKSLNFGVVYGMGPGRFSLITGVPKADAARMIDAFWRKYAASHSWLERMGDYTATRGTARTASGRLARFDVDTTDHNKIEGIRRNGKNTPIQGTGADIVKRALRLLHDALAGTSGRIVNTVHDEIVVEADEADAEAVMSIVERSMIRAGEEFITAVPIEVGAAISPAWSKP